MVNVKLFSFGEEINFGVILSGEGREWILKNPIFYQYLPTTATIEIEGGPTFNSPNTLVFLLEALCVDGAVNIYQKRSFSFELGGSLDKIEFVCVEERVFVRHAGVEFGPFPAKDVAGKLAHMATVIVGFMYYQCEYFGLSEVSLDEMKRLCEKLIPYIGDTSANSN